MKRIRILTYSIDLLTLSKQFLELILRLDCFPLKIFILQMFCLSNRPFSLGLSQGNLSPFQVGAWVLRLVLGVSRREMQKNVFALWSRRGITQNEIAKIWIFFNFLICSVGWLVCVGWCKRHFLLNYSTQKHDDDDDEIHPKIIIDNLPRNGMF